MKYLLIAALLVVFGAIVFAQLEIDSVACTTPVFLTSNTDANIVEYAPQIQKNHIAWGEGDYYGNSTQSLHLLDIGSDMLPGTIDDVGPVVVNNNITNAEFSLSQNFLAYIMADNSVAFCHLSLGGCYPDQNGNYLSVVLGVPQIGERKNLRIDDSPFGQTFVWSENNYSESQSRLVILLPGSSPIFFYPLDSNNASFLPLVKNGIVIWTEIDSDENGLPNWVYVRYYNTQTAVHKILVSSSYHSHHPKVRDLVSYANNSVHLAVHETPSLNYKYYIYNTVNDEMIRRGRITDIESHDFSFDNQKMGGILRQNSNGFMTDSLLYVARNLSTVLIDEAVTPNRISDPKVSEGMAVYSRSSPDVNAGHDVQKIKFATCSS